MTAGPAVTTNSPAGWATRMPSTATLKLTGPGRRSTSSSGPCRAPFGHPRV